MHELTKFSIQQLNRQPNKHTWRKCHYQNDYGWRTISHNLNAMDSVGVQLSYQDMKKLKIALGHMSETTKIITKH